MKKLALWSFLGALALFLVGGGAWIWSLPASSAVSAPPAIAQDERDAALAALKPPKRERPLIAIVGINNATETTDYLMPYGILRRADVADVVALSTEAGPMTLFPALRVEPQATVAEFDTQNPEGADYVIVPAMSRDDDPRALEWIRSQKAKGATVIGVCAGAKVVGAAGLLDGKRGTTHWFYLDELREENPTLRYVADRRIVVEPGVATTTGITASMPMMLTLIEAIAGREKAEAVASELGLTSWDARHDSDAFQLTRPFATTVLRNLLAFWNREQLGIQLAPDFDEVSLALVADAWSRTYRSQAVTFAGTPGPVESRNGIRVLPDEVERSWPGQQMLPPMADRPPAKALDEALAGIERRYGERTTDVVAMQLEYPRRSAPNVTGGLPPRTN